MTPKRAKAILSILEHEETDEAKSDLDDLDYGLANDLKTPAVSQIEIAAEKLKVDKNALLQAFAKTAGER